jgi:hypothetical protein
MSQVSVEIETPSELDATAPTPLLPRLTVTSLGVRDAQGVNVAGAAPQGYFLTGPLCTLEAGDYELALRCRVGAPRVPELPVLGVEVVALGPGQQVWRDFCADELAGEGTVRFRVPPDLGGAPSEAAKFNFKFFHFANADLTLASVELRPLALAQADTTRYRLLGRMAPRKIARSHGGRVTVSWWRKPGCFLAGPALLNLPDTNLRLTVGARAGRPRRGGAPVLGIEVLAGPVQQAYRDFTAEELARNSATIDFAAGLAGREGESPPFTFDFHHFGNADLDVQAIELAPVDNAAVGSSWRLSGRLRRRLLGGPLARLLARLGLRLPLMSGIRPRLRLAAGWYRLSFDVARASPAAALAVELAATCDWRSPQQVRWLFERLRWRLRSTLGVIATHRVTDEEWRAGRAVCDFEASADWSHDGEHVWLDLNFLDAGSGAQVGNVEIRSLTAAEAGIAGRAPAVRRGDRAKLVVYGNCQAEVLGHVLRTELCERFATAYQFIRVNERALERCRRDLEQADILLVQDLADWENYPLRAFVPDKTRVIRFPHLRLASLWPFDHHNGPGDPEAQKKDWPQETFPYLDGLLARLRKETPDPERRFARYAALDVDLVANPVRLHQFEARRLAAMDRRFECDIGRFIVENFQHRRLFHTTSHPTGELFALLLDQLAKILDVKGLHQPGKLVDHHFSATQVPIHPKVAKMLGVTWADETTRYRFRGGEVTWEDYVRQYIRYFG